MIVKAREARPIRQKDGTWKVILRELDEEIPDLGRETIICNKCGWSTYPKCKDWCKAWVYHTKNDLQKG